MSPLYLDFLSEPSRRTILHDPTTYQEPEKFNPDRFLSTKIGDSAPLTHLNVAFGYGRRICPGR